jgi:multiple sugar transport system permease protein
MLRRAIVWLVTALVVLWLVFPFWWAFVLSLAPPIDQHAAVVLPFIQFTPTLDHWRYEWANAFIQDGMAWAIFNSVEVGLLTAAIAAALGLLAAVGAQRLWGGWLPTWPFLGLVLLPRVLPPVTMVVPFAAMLHWLQLDDTRWALVLYDVGLTLPLAILILTSAVRDVPADLFDAAQLDGASMWTAARTVAAPLVAPALVAVGALAFAASWNDYLFAITNHAQRMITPVVAVALLEDKDGVQFEHVASHLVLIIGPPLGMALLAQRYVVRGLSLGAVTG